ncbi:hypothetical protein RND81_12G219700 [Saponaria officinalis]|uniref:Uncharacterized protein n=1 Tax=Saponaria officinalis TaxID=3572 RepID=A0AAW1HDX7_SAPOF
MDALWSLEDKWKISTRKAVALLVFTVISVILVSATVIVIFLRKKGNRNRIACHVLDDDETESSSSSSSSSLSSSVMNEDQNVILSSPCWSMAHKWSNEEYMVKCKYWRILKEMKIMSKCIKYTCVGSKLKPVWQRPILMGEKCEFPKFSGLILYDNKGRQLPHHRQHDQQFANSTSHNNVEQLMVNYQDIPEGENIGSRNTLLKDLL